MLRFRLSTLVMVASVALTGLTLSAPAALAASHHRHYDRVYVVDGYSDVYALHSYEAVFPNTEDYSTECINGYRWMRHQYNWDESPAQAEVPLPCD